LTFQPSPHVCEFTFVCADHDVDGHQVTESVLIKSSLRLTAPWLSSRVERLFGRIEMPWNSISSGSPSFLEDKPHCTGASSCVKLLLEHLRLASEGHCRAERVCELPAAATRRIRCWSRSARSRCPSRRSSNRRHHRHDRR
jgi:hypothetical protein